MPLLTISIVTGVDTRPQPFIGSDIAARLPSIVGRGTDTVTGTRALIQPALPAVVILILGLFTEVLPMVVLQFTDPWVATTELKLVEV